MIWWLLVIATPWVLWIFYTAVMRLAMVRDAGQLTQAMKVFGYPALFIGLVLDFFVNGLFGSVLFLELPNELTLSSRLTRLSNDASETWRRRWAIALRTALLDNIDPAGVHRG